MDFQHHETAQTPYLVLKYEKRRFDGGPEADLIRYLELCQGGPSEEGPQGQALFQAAPQQVAAEPSSLKPDNRWLRILQAMVIGPLEMIVSSTGILAAIVSYVAFIITQNEPLAAQSQSVLKDYTYMFCEGIAHTLCAPCYMFRAAFQA